MLNRKDRWKWSDEDLEEALIEKGLIDKVNKNWTNMGLKIMQEVISLFHMRLIFKGKTPKEYYQ